MHYLPRSMTASQLSPPLRERIRHRTSGSGYLAHRQPTPTHRREQPLSHESGGWLGAPRGAEETDEQQDSSPPGSGRASKGAVNPAEVGTAGCKSRTASTVSEDGGSRPSPREATAGAMVKHARGRPRSLKPALEASVCTADRLRAGRSATRTMSIQWSGATALTVASSCLDPKRRGPELPGVQLDTYRTTGLLSERGNLRPSAGTGEPGKLPSPATSRWRGGASGVVRARESRVHGDRRQ
jgi:hypothetical protein